MRDPFPTPPSDPIPAVGFRRLGVRRDVEKKNYCHVAQFIEPWRAAVSLATSAARTSRFEFGVLVLVNPVVHDREPIRMLANRGVVPRPIFRNLFLAMVSIYF